MEAKCHKCAATCTQSLLKQLGIHARGLRAQPVSLSQEKKRNLLQNMQIYLMLNKQTNCVSNVSVHCDNSVMFLMQFCPFKLSRVGAVWLIKCSASQAAASNVKSVTSFVLVCPYISLHLLSFLIRFSVHV